MSQRTLIRHLEIGDVTEFIARVRSSRRLHRPWVSPPATEEAFMAYVQRMADPAHHAFAVCDAETGQIGGVIHLTNIVLGAFRSGYLGYYAFAGFERQGLMQSGLSQVLRHAFKSLKLHRLEANIQPKNAASIALVRSCGFVQEGYSPKYLKIGGQWRDHERWAILAT